MKRKPNAASPSNSTTNIENAARYIRVSTERQDTNTSKENQLKTIDRYIEEHKLIVNHIFNYEDSHSASVKPKSTNIDEDNISARSGLNQLLFDITTKKISTIFVYSHDRLTRNVQESMLLRYLFTKLKVDVVYCRPGETLNTESDKFNDFFENLLNNLSQLESNLIGSRARLGNKYKVEHKCWPGGPAPYGYRIANIYNKKAKSFLEPKHAEARIVIKIFNLYNSGYTPKDILESIKDEYKGNTDRKWTINTIKSILSNEDYTGIIVWDKKGGARNPIKHPEPIRSPKAHEELISKETWAETQRIKMLQRSSPKYISTSFLLKDLIYCEGCGKKMKTKNNGMSKGRVYYCQPEKNPEEEKMVKKQKTKWHWCIKADEIEKKVISNIFSSLNNFLSDEANFDEFCEEYLATISKNKDNLRKEQTELENDIKKTEDYINKCEKEMSSLKALMGEVDKANLDHYYVFMESMKELNSYLNINRDSLISQKLEIEKKLEKPAPDKIFLRKFLEKTKLSRDALSEIKDKEFYHRKLRLLLIDTIDKVIIKNNDSVNEPRVIFK